MPVILLVDRVRGNPVTRPVAFSLYQAALAALGAFSSGSGSLKVLVT